MTDLERLQQKIRAACPNLNIADVQRLSSGQHCDVLLVNEILVFRFPLYADGRAGLRREVAVLEGLQDRLPLPVPTRLFHQLEEPHPFVACTRLPGAPLWRDTMAAIVDEDIVERLATQLTGFLRALHSLPVKTIAAPLPLADTRAVYADRYARIRQHLFPRMRPAAREQVAAHFEPWLADPANFAWQPVLRHGDFGTDNLLYDAEKGEICGILDFDSLGLGDPAVDYAGLLASYGADFLQRCARFNPDLPSMQERVHFHYGTFALEEALFGYKHGDEAAFAAGMANYV